MQEEKERIKSIFTFQDVLDNKDKNIPLDIRKNYSPLDFWESAAEYFCKSHNKREHFQQNISWLLQKLELLQPKSILDVGCGFGRTLPFIVDGLKDKAPERIEGIDFCQKMVEFSEEYLKDFPDRKKIRILMVDARSMPYKDNEFECVITDTLFTHLKFGDAQKVANEIKRIASKYIITMERFSFEGEHPEPHVWSWDIYKFFKPKVIVLERRGLTPGLVGMVLEKYKD